MEIIKALSDRQVDNFTSELSLDFLINKNDKTNKLNIEIIKNMLKNIA